MSTSGSQQTLAHSASLAGTSLHTGEKVTLTLRPAAPGFGLKFKRIDLPDGPTIDARIENVKTVERATTLAEGNIKVHTVEHVLSALTGLGVDNAVIEMDANEPPIGDGSALAYVELIRSCGVVPQDAPRHVFEVRETVHIETKDGSLLTLVPDPAFRVSCTQVGPGGRFTQYHSLEINPATYEKEIAPARTFTFYEDIQPLLDKGLIKGGSLENAIVVRGDSVLSRDPLRFPDEFARHKILDIVGDLALFGRRIKGHVIAVKPGHGANAELTRALAKQHAQIAALLPAARLPVGDTVLDINEVMRMLPHRYPFLMVDRVIGFEGDIRCRAVKQVSANEPYFPGAFPRLPGDARRTAGRGDGAGGEHPDPAPAGTRGQTRVLHERGRREIPQTRHARRHADHPRRADQGSARHPQGDLPLHGQRRDRQRGGNRPEHVQPLTGRPPRARMSSSRIHPTAVVDPARGTGRGRGDRPVLRGRTGGHPGRRLPVAKPRQHPRSGARSARGNEFFTVRLRRADVRRI